MAYQEFYADASTGSNQNGGSNEGSANYSETNGNWNATTGVWTCAGSPDLSGLSVGEYAHVCLDSDTGFIFIGRVTGVDNGAKTITVDVATRKVGTAPTTGATGRTINVGGALQGPTSTNVNFPFGNGFHNCTGGNDERVRINFKNTAIYSITSTITQSGKVIYQGYTATIGDGGYATIQGPATGASFVLVNINTQSSIWREFIFDRNGDSGTADCVTVTSGVEAIFVNCKFSNAMGDGLDDNGNTTCIECEAHDNAVSGFRRLSTGYRCYSHDNGGTGFGTSTSLYRYIECISARNTTGFNIPSIRATNTFYKCDVYDNSSHGLTFTDNSAGEAIVLENCNFVKNGGYGITTGGLGNIGDIIIYMRNCGFGGGAYANTSGKYPASISDVYVVDEDEVNYTTHPWADPDNDDFTVTSAEAKNLGRGTFITAAPGFPDLGSTQHQDTGGTVGGYIIGA